MKNIEIAAFFAIVCIGWFGNLYPQHSATDSACVVIEEEDGTIRNLTAEEYEEWKEKEKNSQPEYEVTYSSLLLENIQNWWKE